jgi:hypothetical protein
MANGSVLSAGLTGVAGEYFVAAELSRRGYIATLTLKNTRGIDILVANTNATKSQNIQVKTNQGRKKEWTLNHKAENHLADNLFYVFVNLKESGELPDFHIVPSKIVAEYCKRTHSQWLAALGRKGQKRNDSTVRKYADPDGQYLGRWELLNLD